MFPSRNSLVVFKGVGLRGALDVVLDGYPVSAVFVLDGDVCHFSFLIKSSTNALIVVFFSLAFLSKCSATSLSNQIVFRTFCIWFSLTCNFIYHSTLIKYNVKTLGVYNYHIVIHRY